MSFVRLPGAERGTLRSPETRRKSMAKVWLNGELVDQDQAKLSVFDHGLLYGDGCFEGIRAYGGRI